jgi:hypothetical protein
MAEEELRNAKDVVEITRARELASHFRWLSSKMDVATWGDKLAVGGAPGLPPLAAPPMSDYEAARRLAFILASGSRQANEQWAKQPLPQLAHTPKPNVNDCQTTSPLERGASKPRSRPS